MKRCNSRRAAAGLLTAGLCALFPVLAQAQTATDEWKWGATIYGWFPAIGGSTSFPSNAGGGGGGGGGPSIDVSTKQVIDALKFAFMGSIEGRKGQWGFWTDVVYADFGASKSATRDFTVGHEPLPVGVDANLSLDIKSWIWTLAGTYNLVSKPDYTLDALAGARLLDMDQTLGWSFSGTIGESAFPPRSGSANVTVSNWDGVVGVKGRASFGADHKWFVPYYLDVGTGQSKFTWQAIAGIGYEFGWGSVVGAWRYLGYDMKSGKPIESLHFSGPAIGVMFRW